MLSNLSPVGCSLLKGYPTLNQVPESELHHPSFPLLIITDPAFQLVDNYIKAKNNKETASRNWVINNAEDSWDVFLTAEYLHPQSASLPIILYPEEARTLPLMTQETNYDQAIAQYDNEMKKFANEWKVLRSEMEKELKRRAQARQQPRGSRGLPQN